jgi:hypothetical protein
MEVPDDDTKWDIPLRYFQVKPGRPYQFVHVQPWFQAFRAASARAGSPAWADPDQPASNLHDGREDTYASLRKPAGGDRAWITLDQGNTPKLYNFAAACLPVDGRGRLINPPRKIEFSLTLRGAVVARTSLEPAEKDGQLRKSKKDLQFMAYFDQEGIEADSLRIECWFPTGRDRVYFSEAWAGRMKAAYNPQDLHEAIACAVARWRHDPRSTTTLILGDEMNQATSFEDYFGVYAQMTRSAFYYLAANELDLGRSLRFSPCGFAGEAFPRWNGSATAAVKQSLPYAEEFCRRARREAIPVDELRFHLAFGTPIDGFRDAMKRIGDRVTSAAFPGPHGRWVIGSYYCNRGTPPTALAEAVKVIIADERVKEAVYWGLDYPDWPLQEGATLTPMGKEYRQLVLQHQRKRGTERR